MSVIWKILQYTLLGVLGLVAAGRAKAVARSSGLDSF